MARKSASNAARSALPNIGDCTQDNLLGKARRSHTGDQENNYLWMEHN